MTTEHPITPAPELVRQWAVYRTGHESPEQLWHNVATQAARWGWEQRGAANEAELQKARDEELEVCCEWLIHEGWFGYPSIHEAIRALRDARRPQPPSLKEEALAAIARLKSEALCLKTIADAETIRRALEQLDD